MILAILLVIIGILNVFFKRSKPIFIVSAILMWTIIAFTYGNADEGIYISRYENPYRWLGSSEWLFSAMINICRAFKLNFVQYKAVLALIYMLLTSTTIWKLSKYPNVVLTLFFICPFIMNVSQLRFGMASAILIFSYRYLLHDESPRIGNSKRNITENDVKFVICVIVASLMHSSAIYWLLLLVPKKTTVKTTTIWMLLINAFVLFIFNPSSVGWLLSKLGAQSRMLAYFSSEYRASEYRHIGASLLTTLLIGGIVFLLCLLVKRKRKCFQCTDDVYELLKFNIMLWTVISFIIRYTSEMYRPQEALMLMSYIVLTNSINKSEFLKLKTNLSSFELEIGVFSISAIGFYTKIIMYQNYLTLWMPIFHNSYLYR
jgi:hypothetical protein